VFVKKQVECEVTHLRS